MYEGKLVRLRAPENGDLAPLLLYLNDYQTMRGAVGSLLLPVTEEDACGMLAAQGGHSRGEYQFSVETLAEGRMIGRCGFVSVDTRNRQAECAILIGDPAFRGRGYGSDALRTLCRFGFDEMNLHRIWARVLDFNEASLRCFTQCGFCREGVLRQDCWREGAWHDTVLLALLEREAH